MLHNNSQSIRRRPISLKPSTGIRRYDRTGFDQEVLVQDDEGWEIQVDSVDISANGMFVKSAALFEVGDLHTLHFFDENGSPFRVDARVVRVAEHSNVLDEDSGMGYEFQGIDEYTYDALCGAIATL